MPDIKAPTEVDNLISLKLDPVSLSVHFDQSQLLLAIRKVITYVKDLHDNLMEETRNELELQLACLRKDLTCEIGESAAELETNLGLRIDQLDINLQNLTSDAQRMDTTVLKMKEQVIQVTASMAQIGAGGGGYGSYLLQGSTDTVPEAMARQESGRSNADGADDEEDALGDELRPISPASAAALKRASTGMLADGSGSDKQDIMGRRATSTGSGASPSPGPGDAASRATSRHPTGGPRASPLLVPPSTTPGGRSRGPAASGQQLAALKEAVQGQLQGFREELEALMEQKGKQKIQPAQLEGVAVSPEEFKQMDEKLTQQLRALETMFAEDTSGLTERIDEANRKADAAETSIRMSLRKHDEGLASCRREEMILKGKLEKEQTKVKELQEKSQALQTAQQQLGELKADKTTAKSLKEELDWLKSRMELLPTTVVIDQQFMKVDDGLEVLKERLSRQGNTTEVLQEEMVTTRRELGAAKDESTSSSGRLQQQLYETVNAVENLRNDFSAQIIRVDGTAGAHRELTGDLQLDLEKLRNAMSLMAQEGKDREQAVLFGARCLSCNRVFDEVAQEAGTVDVRGEKQREKLYAEVQRAFHSAKHDPTKPIKMIAVKVGRPETVSSGTPGRYNAPYSGRDWGSLSCGVEDVQLLTSRQGCSSLHSSSERRARTADGSSGGGLPPMPHQAADLAALQRGTMGDGHASPLAASGAVSLNSSGGVDPAGSGRRKKSGQEAKSDWSKVRKGTVEHEGSMDYKTPLSQLVGR
eukprot:TRINITY_DN75097_c0_g1_i1.p1 TRINITY_DN75097_c0_g1~~TRINITY_DN75097_c0_g1_i1.p1  ORF type:complete len:761 (+),score=251.23 TRINITY_DN75097_c0_g1_i1:165-2447(+)